MSLTEELVPRCCDRHDDWSVVAQHLCDVFPQLPPVHVIQELVVVREVTSILDPADALDVGYLLARQRLMLACGERRDAAKLDPQNHDKRGCSAALQAAGASPPGP